MRFVQHAAVRPHHCAVLPYLGNSSSRGFIDTGSELDGFDNHVYVSVEAVEAMAQMIEWQSPVLVRALERELADARAAARAHEAELVELRAFRAAVHTLKDAGMQSARKPGRPKNGVVADAA